MNKDSKNKDSKKKDSKKKVLIIGCGDIGIRLAIGLQPHAAAVYGLRRQTQSLPDTIEPLQANVTRPESLRLLANYRFDTAVVTLTPGEYSDARYQLIFEQGVANVLAVLQAEHVIFVSSTSVYHQTNQQWVTEDSPTKPTRFAGLRLLRAEELVKSAAAIATVVRFSGIYGPGRNRLIQQVLAGKQSGPTFSNRIHQDDCAGFLQHLIMSQWQKADLHSCYLATDNEPALLSEVKLWIAQQLKIEFPQSATDDTSRSLSRRCCNQRMLDTGYTLKYPDYKSGYAAMVEAQIANRG